MNTGLPAWLHLVLVRLQLGLGLCSLALLCPEVVHELLQGGLLRVRHEAWRAALLNWAQRRLEAINGAGRVERHGCWANTVGVSQGIALGCWTEASSKPVSLCPSAVVAGHGLLDPSNLGMRSRAVRRLQT